MDDVPVRYTLDPDNPKTVLREALLKALNALPHYFSSKINIEGLTATDLFSLNSLLGGAIEEQTVTILNSMRSIWDPNGLWYDREFIRFPESFPDVRLVRGLTDTEPVIGIELKGWYLLSKEKEPSFRYKASADATTVWDLIVCYPWVLSNVLSGCPAVYEPYIEQAKYAANMRTYYWSHRRGTSSTRSNEILHPDTHPYPRPGSKYADNPQNDSGKNFGRIARVPGLMTDWINKTMEIKLSGIEARYWISFFSAFVEGNTQSDIESEIERLYNSIDISAFDVSDNVWREIIEHIHSLAVLILNSK